MKNTFLNEYQTRKALSEFILQTNKLSMDEKCREFEIAFSKYQGRKAAILYNSGGSANLALLQALKNLGRLTAGDKVGFSALTWSTNVMPIFQMGFEAIPVDCTPSTLNVMSDNLEAALKTDKLKALFITNALGFAGDLDNIRSVCKKNNVLLIEDNCEALGTELLQGKTGNFGEASTFSFFVAHHMSTIEGGMICTDDDELEEMLRVVRANGWDRNLPSVQQVRLRKKYGVASEFFAKYTFYDLGYNLRPTEITGFLGLYQLQFIEENVLQRQRNYLALEAAVCENDDLITLSRSHLSRLSSFSFPIVCKTNALRERYIAQFSGAGIEIRPMIAGNIERQPFFKKYNSNPYKLEGAEFLHQNSFYCGNYPELTLSDMEIIKSCLVKYE